MNRAEYIGRLEKQLHKIPAERRQEILDDIGAHFDEGALAGVAEDVLAAGLGQPEILAREYRATIATERAEEKTSARNVFRAIWAGIGMGMLNLIFVLPLAAALFAAYVALLAAGFAMALAGILSALLCLVNAFVPLPFVAVFNSWFGVFASISICALGCLLLIGMVRLGKRLAAATLNYLKTNIDIIAGRRKENAAI